MFTFLIVVHYHTGPCSTILYHDITPYSSVLYCSTVRRQVLFIFSLELVDLLTEPVLEVLADLKS